MKKLTLDYVKSFIEEYDINHECELLATEYVNASTPLALRCNVCGENFKRDFNHIRNKVFKCKKCAYASLGGKNRLSIDCVKQYLKEYDLNNECEVLSTEYTNGSKPLLFRCNLCGTEFKRSFYGLKKNKNFCCVRCANDKKRKYTLKDVKLFLEENDINHNCTLLSTEYTAAKDDLRFKCNICGEEFNRSFSLVQYNHYFCCPLCASKIGKYTQEDVEKFLANQNCTLIEPYPGNINKAIHCRCGKGHEFETTFAKAMKNQYICLKCSYEARRGENSPSWKNGGNQETLDLLRHSLQEWKKAVLEKANYKCDICGQPSEDLVIHHARKNFSVIVEEASKNINIPILPHIADYSNEDRQKLISEVQRLHEVENGRVITREYHRLFHKKYGTRNNTLEQYNAFKKEQQEKLMNK